MKVEFTILGECVSMKNSRELVHFGKKPALIKSAKAREYERTVGLQIPESARLMLTGRLRIEVHAFYASERPDLDCELLYDCLAAKFKRHKGRLIRIGPGEYQYGIPFIFLGVDDVTPDVDEPPLIDLVDMNLSHYRASADYEHGCHFTGLPTAVVSGYSPPSGNDGVVEKLYIGSATAWVFTEPQASAKFLEFTGQGLEALAKNLERKEQQMAVLGARMLEALKKGVESAQTASIHRVGEESMLAAVAQTISLGMTRALVWFCDWAGTAVDARVDINKDFYPVEITFQEIAALVAAWQAGAISDQVLFDNLQQGEIIAQGVTLEEEQARKNTAPPKIAPGLGGTGDPPVPST